MQPDSRCELHKIVHRRTDELGPGRRWHVDISIRNHRPISAIHNPSVYAGNVIQVLIGDAKSSRRCQMPRAAGADFGLHDRAVVVQQISFLLRQIEFDGILRKRQPR